ncbi:MAG: alpha-1,2-fucosyltransferase [Planctomycetaceae bacterium]|nr:alpha-1,2-fucosyltransferase [Planctomycetaceae bacterium]
MLVFRIFAGLGNQLFQYAAGRALAARYGCDFVIDTSDVGSSHRIIGINAFNITAQEVDPMIAKRLRFKKNLWVRIMKVLTKRDIRRGNPFFIQNLTPDEFDAIDIDPIHNDYYFEGFYQSERNFVEYTDVIRAELTLRTPFENAVSEGKNGDIAKAMADCNSVSMHIRRGDYYATKRNRRNYAIPLADYCHKAMRLIGDRITNPKYFVFSDDFNWVRENIKFDNPYEFVEGNDGSKVYCDIVLMSRCCHHIISNSTFSWWGAWLNPRSDKQVITPFPWSPASPPQDNVPNEWIKLDYRS